MLAVYITKLTKYKNKGKHLQMEERGGQPKMYQETRGGFLLFKKLINPFHMTPCLPQTFLINGYINKVHLESCYYGTSSNEKEKNDRMQRIFLM